MSFSYLNIFVVINNEKRDEIKMMKTICYLAATAFMLASTAVSAATVPTVWAPTNEDVDFIQFDLPGLSLTTSGGTLAMFDEADFGGDALVIGEFGGHVTFTASGSNWIAQFFDVSDAAGDSITLTGNSHFVLGINYNDGLGYIADDGKPIPASSPDSYMITFRGGTPDGEKLGQTLAVDVKVVPVPAAAWLFGSGLIGLVVVARRHA
ncbi:MAG: hypothetical protein DRQ44_09215 [Gammaproteobacteria bacterium]|nr:MAG: hypothetical protein DRQ44_09215 [Gammaproteobacteria bacterium]